MCIAKVTEYGEHQNAFQCGIWNLSLVEIISLKFSRCGYLLLFLATSATKRQGRSWKNVS